MALGIGALALGAGGWIAVRGIEARDHLLRASSLVTALQTEATAGNVGAERVSLAALQREAAAAKSATSDPLWRAAAALPFVGRNPRAVATIATAADDLATTALPALVEASASVDLRQLAPRHAQIDLAALQHAAAPVTAADVATQRVTATIKAMSTAGLLPQVSSAVARVRVQLQSAAQTTATARRLMTLLPPMLGADGPRTYALLFMNNSELRADGGIPGAWAIVRADRGQVTIVSQGSANDVDAHLKGVAVPADVAALFTNRAGSYFQDVTLTPDFPEVAQLAASMLQQAYGVLLDGVFATDPIALADVLRATGPVPLATGGSLTATNAVSLLLSGVYRLVPDPKQQDAFFASAAKSVFDALSSGAGDPRAVVQSLADAADHGRLLAWSAHPTEEQQLDATPMAGLLPTTDAPDHPSIGVFLNAGTATKLSYYLREKVAVSNGGCLATGVGYRVHIELSSAVPAVTSLPQYVLGNGAPGLPQGGIRTQVYVYAPTGGALTTATQDGITAKLGTGTESGRAVGVVTVDLTPGQTTSLDVGVVSGALSPAAQARGVAASVRVTPMAVPASVTSSAASCTR